MVIATEFACIYHCVYGGLDEDNNGRYSVLRIHFPKFQEVCADPRLLMVVSMLNNTRYPNFRSIFLSNREENRLGLTEFICVM
ncbi:hypothetical protein PanWU01x14_300910 [Parasponia andersonii]|uniref:Uncharacterized protein n=1 Tax=Parasponia andersonii TaxID=3476 RepID=A0A2P5ATS2_PARAD|nr:hypothetical protein PanWU01x14_300910 [Parasponia andersonii]